MSNQCDLRTRLINHVIFMKKHDQDYARYALMEYHKELPDYDLVAGVRAAL